MLLFGIWCCQCEGLMLRQRKLVLGLFVGFFCLFQGKLYPRLGKGYFLFLSLPSILLGPAKEEALFCGLLLVLFEALRQLCSPASLLLIVSFGFLLLFFLLSYRLLCVLF